ncbi:hypothetical protein PWT90_00682 [Aphanocladium album]|nr:hypothetical protein PWT90_00682 [Aphanocladium album]
MDQLPQEIIDRIAAFLPEDKQEMAEPATAPEQAVTAKKRFSIIKNIASKVHRIHGQDRQQQQGETLPQPPTKFWTRADAATISYRWQRAVEPVVYSKLTLGYSGIAKLKHALERRPERRSYLRSLTVVLALTHEHRTYIGIKDALPPLFEALSSEKDKSSVELTLRFEAADHDLRHSTRQGMVFDRIHSKALGDIACVKRLDFTPLAPNTEKERRNVLQLHLVEQASLIQHFPNLQSVRWYFTESESQAIRNAARDAFGKYLEANLPKIRGLTQFSLTLSLGVLGIRIQAPSGVGADSYEALYQRLHTATQHATDLSYSGVVSPSFFKTNNDDNDDERIWPSLRNLTVGLALLSPAGQWYFDGDFSLIDFDTPLDWRPRYATLQEGQHDGIFDEHPFWFRELPVEDAMLPLLSAFAGLVERQPVLETARLVARRGAGQAPPWAVCYLAPGKTCFWVDENDMDMEKPRVWFVTGRWRPKEELVRQFRRAGKGAGHGDNVSIIYWSMLDAPVRI